MRSLFHALRAVPALLILSATAYCQAPATHVSASSRTPVRIAKLQGSAMKGGHMKPGHGKMGGAMAGAKVSYTGPVKGAVSGKMFTLALKGKTVTVDASKATIRQNGKFASISSISGGTFVTVKGALNGTTLAATDVSIHARGGKKAAGAKMGGKPGMMGKMRGVMKKK